MQGSQELYIWKGFALKVLGDGIGGAIGSLDSLVWQLVLLCLLRSCLALMCVCGGGGGEVGGRQMAA